MNIPGIGLLACLFFFSVTACVSSENYSASVNDYSKYGNLAEAISSIGGVQVIGGNTLAGKNEVFITLRGQGSIVLNTQPLYVINNVPVGNDYSYANSIVHPADIVSIRVIRGTAASTLYGEEGNHGAIIIRTKNYKVKN